MRHPSEEQLIAFRFGDVDASEAAAVAEHVGTCEACGASLRAIDLALAASAQLPVPERSEGYGAEVWARLQPRLRRPSPWAWLAPREWLTTKRLAFAGGMAVLVLAAFVAGRFSQPVPSAPSSAVSRPSAARAVQEEARGPEQPETGAARELAGARPTRVPEERLRRTVLLVAVGDHLERSQMALVELVNLSDGHEVDIAPEQERARDLVVENRLIRQTAADTGNAALAAILDDLERVLVEVANGPSAMSKAEFDGVRQRIESQGIIFKVRALGEHVRELETRPAADGRVQG